MSLFENFKSNVTCTSAGDQKPWFILPLLHYYVQRLFYVCYDKGCDWMNGEVMETLKNLNIAGSFRIQWYEGCTIYRRNLRDTEGKNTL